MLNHVDGSIILDHLEAVLLQAADMERVVLAT